MRARIELGLASLNQDMGDLADARRHAEASLALQRASEDAHGIADALNLLGTIALGIGDTDAARSCFEEALSLVSDQDHTRRGILLQNLALRAQRRGEIETARQFYAESLTDLRAAGDLRTEAITLGNLGALAHDAGNHPEARHLYYESLALRRALRERRGIAVLLNNLGELAELDGDVETAIVLFVHAELLFRDLPSIEVDVPARSLERLAERLGATRFAQLRAVAERTAWERVVDRDQDPSLAFPPEEACSPATDEL